MWFWKSLKKQRHWVQSQHPSSICWEMVTVWKWRGSMCLVKYAIGQCYTFKWKRVSCYNKLSKIGVILKKLEKTKTFQHFSFQHTISRDGLFGNKIWNWTGLHMSKWVSCYTKLNRIGAIPKKPEKKKIHQSQLHLLKNGDYLKMEGYGVIGMKISNWT